MIATPPEQLFADASADLRWRRRIRAVRVSVPLSARHAPERSIYRSTASGTAQVYAWDRNSGVHHQITHQPAGVQAAAITPDGNWIWWFADTGGDEFGHWRRAVFPADPVAGPGDGSAPALPGVPEGYNTGLLLADELAIAGLTGTAGTEIWAMTSSGSPQLLLQLPDGGELVDLMPTGDLMALSYITDGGRSQGARVVDTSTGRTAGDLLEPDQQLVPMGFRPSSSTPQLLVGHDRDGRTGLLLWDLATGAASDLPLELPGEVTGHWLPSGLVLLLHDFRARSTLHALDVSTGQLEQIPTPPGSIDETRGRSDGLLEYSWSSAAEPWQVRSTAWPRSGEGGAGQPGAAGEAVLGPPAAVPTSEPVTTHWVPGPGGAIHVLLSRPPGLDGALPTVFRLHGGPHVSDQDSWHAMRAAWLDAGFQVIQLNYRGSSGYGPAWRDAIIGRPGLTELEDVTAVQEWAVASGLTPPQACIAEGYSWGGMLALLCVGVQPDRWAAAIAGLPVADAVSTYYSQMEPLRASDRRIFGGTPEEVPAAYRQASPSTYLDNVRAPVLLLAGERDPRCPIEQVRAYAEALGRAGATVELQVFDMGHGPQGSALVEEMVLNAVPFARSVVQTAPGRDGEPS